MVDTSTRKTLSSIPLLQTKAGPRDKELWVQRLKEEYQALIKVYVHLFATSLGHCNSQFYAISSTFRTTRTRARIGFAWNRTRRERNGLENVGPCTNY